MVKTRARRRQLEMCKILEDAYHDSGYPRRLMEPGIERETYEAMHAIQWGTRWIVETTEVIRRWFDRSDVWRRVVEKAVAVTYNCHRKEAGSRVKICKPPFGDGQVVEALYRNCLLYTSPSPRDRG